MKFSLPASLALAVLLSGFAAAAPWTQFRGPGGLGSGDAKGLPVKWSSDENIA